MHNIGLILLCFAFVFGCFASFGVSTFGRVHTGWLALTLMIAAQLIGGLAPVFR